MFPSTHNPESDVVWYVVCLGMDFTPSQDLPGSDDPVRIRVCSSQ